MASTDKEAAATEDMAALAKQSGFNNVAENLTNLAQRRRTEVAAARTLPSAAKARRPNGDEQDIQKKPYPPIDSLPVAKRMQNLKAQNDSIGKVISTGAGNVVHGLEHFISGAMDRMGMKGH